MVIRLEELLQGRVYRSSMRDGLKCGVVCKLRSFVGPVQRQDHGLEFRA